MFNPLVNWLHQNCRHKLALCKFFLNKLVDCSFWRTVLTTWIMCTMKLHKMQRYSHHLWPFLCNSVLQTHFFQIFFSKIFNVQYIKILDFPQTDYLSVSYQPQVDHLPSFSLELYWNTISEYYFHKDNFFEGKAYNFQYIHQH